MTPDQEIQAAKLATEMTKLADGVETEIVVCALGVTIAALMHAAMKDPTDPKGLAHMVMSIIDPVPWHVQTLNEMAKERSVH